MSGGMIEAAAGIVIRASESFTHEGVARDVFLVLTDDDDEALSVMVLTPDRAREVSAWLAREADHAESSAPLPRLTSLCAPALS